MPITEEMEMGARDLGIKLEIIGGLSVWERLPFLGHQEAVDRIRRSMRANGTDATNGTNDRVTEVIAYNDLSLLFPDGSQTRPDISIFCREPDEDETDVTLVPEAVIEILSKGYEAKDMRVGVPFYLEQGVKDVVVLDPRSMKVWHFRHDGTRDLVSPVEIVLECGCVCTV